MSWNVDYLGGKTVGNIACGNTEGGADVKNTLNGVKVKIVALGKTGSNVINKIILNNVVKADFIAIDTEKLNLDSSKAPKKIFVSSITSFEAMEDLRKQTEKEFQNADMVFIIAEMGEKTGTLLSSCKYLWKRRKSLCNNYKRNIGFNKKTGNCKFRLCRH